jgi:hypothetical protein
MIHAETCWCLRIYSDQLKTLHVIPIETDARGKMLNQVKFAHTGNRLQVQLAIDGSRVICCTIKMNGQLRDARNSARSHQNLLPVRVNKPTRKFKLSVEPRVKDWSAIDFDTNLSETVRAERGVRFDGKAW